ncbi:NUDIX hydrolase [Candidatus Kaiserbacteria bacterium]|nr:NUDIX hydrolase [Candidatus Kaiserbacteria bacterium]
MKEKPAPHPAHLRFATIATDVVPFTIRDGELLVRLIAVDRPPYYTHAKGLPGGLIDPKETAEEAAVRHLQEKAGIKASKTHIEQLYTFSAIDRDPRGRVVAVSYLAFVPWEALSPAEQADTKGAWWSRIKDAHKLAYDHDEMLQVALARLRSRVTYTTLIGKLMPKEFTLTELEQAYEAIVKTDLDKRNFRKKILKLNILKALTHKRTGGRFRPAQLYSFVSDKVREIEVL